MKRKILVCTRGKKCPKRGSLGIFETIAGACGADSQVIGCKCLGMCKKGPAVVVMPGKQRFKRVSTDDAMAIARGVPLPEKGFGKKKKK
ncbi:MAG: (2Fe-2S) ferredoxin domain-containing protein [Candidatus Melainabacteria bacterium]|nr:(2Fe-2S) ferredoxin domain-containing protein [Candidatus Melainabacteria bacterium]